MRNQASALRLAILLAIGAGTVAGGASPARAERRVVVLDFAGTRLTMLSEDIRDALEDRFELVSSRAYERAARRMHAETFKAPHVARVSHAIEADAVVGGRVEQRSGRYILHLRIFSGADGELLKGFAVSLRDRSMSSGLLRKLSRKLGKTIARARVMQRSEPTRAVVRSEPRRPVARKKTRTASKPRRVRRSRAVQRSRELSRSRAAKPGRAVERRRTARRSRTDRRVRRAVKRPPRRAAPRRAVRRAPRRTEPRRAVRRAPRRTEPRRTEPRRAERKPERRPQRRRPVKRQVKEKPFKMVEKTDKRGNVIDDEVPDILRKK